MPMLMRAARAPGDNHISGNFLSADLLCCPGSANDDDDDDDNNSAPASPNCQILLLPRGARQVTQQQQRQHLLGTLFSVLPNKSLPGSSRCLTWPRRLATICLWPIRVCGQRERRKRKILKLVHLRAPQHTHTQESICICFVFSYLSTRHSRPPRLWLESLHTPTAVCQCRRLLHCRSKAALSAGLRDGNLICNLCALIINIHRAGRLAG